VVTLGQCLAAGFHELPGILIEGALEDCFLVAIGVVEAAALDAGGDGEVLHGRVVEALAPEHVERGRDHLVFVKLTHAYHFGPAPSFHAYRSILSIIVKIDIPVNFDIIVKIDVNVKDGSGSAS